MLNDRFPICFFLPPIKRRGIMSRGRVTCAGARRNPILHMQSHLIHLHPTIQKRPPPPPPPPIAQHPLTHLMELLLISDWFDNLLRCPLFVLALVFVVFFPFVLFMFSSSHHRSNVRAPRVAVLLLAATVIGVTRRMCGGPHPAGSACGV